MRQNTGQMQRTTWRTSRVRCCAKTTSK